MQTIKGSYDLKVVDFHFAKYSPKEVDYHYAKYSPQELEEMCTLTRCPRCNSRNACDAAKLKSYQNFLEQFH